MLGLLTPHQIEDVLQKEPMSMMKIVSMLILQKARS